MSIWWGSRGKASAEARQTINVAGGMWFEPAVYPTTQPDSYANVNLTQVETSLQSVAVGSTVDLIASLGSELPVDVYSGTGPGRTQLPMPGYLEDPDGAGHGLPDWTYQVLVSYLLRGNLYGDILDQSCGYPTQVVLHHPDDVGGWVDDDGRVHWTVGGIEVTNVQRFLHRRVNPIPGRVLGLSQVASKASQIGISLISTRFGEQWFRDGAHPSAMLQNTEKDLTGTNEISRVKDVFLAAVYGTREPLVLGKGWDYKPISVTPEESQFLETQGWTEAQCARIFGPGFAEILGYESGGSMTYANVESRSAHLLVYSMNKWLRRVERLLTSMLPPGQYVRINRDAMLQTTTLERFKAHESALKNRWRTVNEVRAIEDEPPVAWGDEPNPAGTAQAGDNSGDPTGAEAPQKGK